MDSRQGFRNSSGSPIARLFIANRGEIAVRIARTARLMGIETCGVSARNEAPGEILLRSLDVHAVAGVAGPAAYLDGEALIATAREQGCDALHPGYGFLSESAAFAEACQRAGLVWVGPDPEALQLFGDKAAALALARAQGVPTVPGSPVLKDLDAAREWLERLGGVALLKAVAGGGGRGMRIVRDAAALETAFARASSEARTAFGAGDLYMERLLERARHIEVQIVADGQGGVAHLGERECTLQRRHQKLVEIAPAPGLAPPLRNTLWASALQLARAANYRGVGTFEFLIDDTAVHAGAEPRDSFVFIEANARLQVEHTVTEEVSGVDLVQAQILIAAGAALSELPGFAAAVDETKTEAASRGYAIQLRINAQSMDDAGLARPAQGKLERFETPGGPGVRVDTAAHAGYEAADGFDSLLAKLIVHRAEPDFARVLELARLALKEFCIAGIQTNLEFLQRLLDHPEVRAHRIYTRFVDEHWSEFIDASPKPAVGLSDPGKAGEGGAGDDRALIRAKLRGRIIEAVSEAFCKVRAGEELAVLEAMKMEHVIVAPRDGVLVAVHARAGDAVDEGQLLFEIEAQANDNAAAGAIGAGQAAVTASAPESASTASSAGPASRRIRADLKEVLDRRALGSDALRPRAVAKRHKRGQRTARENIDDLCDPGSFQEYGGLALAAQRRRRTLKELIQLSPADGLVAGVAAVNGELFGPGLETRAPNETTNPARCAVMSYDYTVFAGTQGAMNHKKTDRLIHVVRDLRLPFIVFAEGGGGRPGDTDVAVVAGLDLTTFRDYAGLSGIAPRIAIASGRCFAGNAALFGCSDITIATQDATIGMGGPVMVKGGGLGTFRAEEIGPAKRQAENGVVDVLVADEVEAVRTAKRALSYFQGSLSNFSCADSAKLRDAIPEKRLRAYDVRGVITGLADSHSVLELRRDFAPGMITALIRVGGRPMGLFANNPAHLAGAIDAPAADKAARFLQLCDAFDLPVLSLCDTPGIMVGPEAESQALVRHASRLFLAAGSISVPVFTIVLRKGYGLGAMAMAGGGFHAPVFTVAWPTGEFGAMGLEGAVSTGFQKELAEVKDWDERQRLFDRLVSEAYEQGKALNMASHLEIDDVIDPADSRDWILRGLKSLPPIVGWAAREKRKRMIDSW
ncbi:MAG: carbamoyl-phosphate synthase large subunit [bacterium]|nr:carbamoyl-phosphate synthase large subunit [bacterium]